MNQLVFVVFAAFLMKGCYATNSETPVKRTEVEADLDYEINKRQSDNKTLNGLKKMYVESDSPEVLPGVRKQKRYSSVHILGQTMSSSVKNTVFTFAREAILYVRKPREMAIHIKKRLDKYMVGKYNCVLSSSYFLFSISNKRGYYIYFKMNGYYILVFRGGYM
ncbi:uncharacterized protein LOC127712986 [Mytilus californianus]|uniref:uncharacterized protein LOC127712986 n=1 Tax=Mytilus californianus TaxID=6549 RepID=UPI002246661C|nr:uncharacterized protein LOC127712986 [Mytilus californianus]